MTVTTWVINSVTFDPESPDGDGDIFKMNDVEGWNSPEVQHYIHENMSDGDTISYSRLKGFFLTATGYVLTTEQGKTRATAKIEAAFANTITPTNLTKTWVDGTTETLPVRRSGPVRTVSAGRPVITFEVPLISLATAKVIIP